MKPSQPNKPDSRSQDHSSQKPGTLAALQRNTNRPALFAAILFGTLVTLAVLSPGKLSYLWMGLLALSATVYLFHQGRRAKEILFRTHVEDSSKWQKFRFSYLLILAFALGGGLILPVSMVVFLLTTNWVVLAAGVALQFLFLPVRGWWLHILGANLRVLSRKAVGNYLTVFTLGLFTAILLIGAKWMEMREIPDMVLANADLTVDRIKGRVNHDINWLCYLARTMAMFDLQLLRARHFAEGWVANLILIYFLLPSALAAFAMPVIYGGLLMFCRREKSFDRETPEK